MKPALYRSIPPVKREQFGVRFLARGYDDPCVCLQIISEDDGNWSEHNGPFAAMWIDDLVLALNTAKKQLMNYAVLTHEGWEFKLAKGESK